MALACNELTGDFSDVIALEYTGPPAPRIEEGDTVRLTARVLDRQIRHIPSRDELTQRGHPWMFGKLP